MAQRPKYFNTGSIFYNEKKEKDSHPDMKGLIDVEGTLFWVVVWWKKTKKGDDFQSVSVKPVTDEELDKYFEGQSAPEGYYESKSQDKPKGNRPGPKQGDHRNPSEADRPAQPARDRDYDFDDMDDDLPF